MLVNRLDTIKKYERDISTNWKNASGAILTTCELLAKAKKELSKDEFENLDLPFTKQTKNRLIAIGNDKRLRSHDEAIPPSWGTLYVLTRLDDDKFSKAVSSGDISPAMTRADAYRLVEGKSDATNNPTKDKVVAFVVYARDKDQGAELLDRFEDAITSIDGTYLKETITKSLEASQNMRYKKWHNKATSLAYKYLKSQFNKTKEKKVKEYGKEKFRKIYAEFIEFFDFNSIKSLQTDDESSQILDEMLAIEGGGLDFNYFLNESFGEMA